MKFGQKLKQLRKERGLTQDDLIAVINSKRRSKEVNRYTLSKWENGIHHPNMQQLVILSDFFKVSLDILLRDSKKLEPQKVVF